jgi:hypothetical protein
MIYNVVIEGQTIPVPEEVGTNDEAVKRALTPFFPEAANALITRIDNKQGTTTINVVKRAGSKGTGLAALIACEGGKNPAIALYEKIETMEQAGYLDYLQALAMDEQINQSLADGEEQAQAVKFAAKRLALSTARPAPLVIQGF